MFAERTNKNADFDSSGTTGRTAGSENASTDNNCSSIKSSRKRSAAESSKDSSNHDGSGNDDEGSDEHRDRRPRKDSDLNVFEQTDGKITCPFFQAKTVPIQGFAILSKLELVHCAQVEV